MMSQWHELLTKYLNFLQNCAIYRYSLFIIVSMIPNSYSYLLCLKLCRHNCCMPSTITGLILGFKTVKRTSELINELSWYSRVLECADCVEQFVDWALEFADMCYQGAICRDSIGRVNRIHGKQEQDRNGNYQWKMPEEGYHVNNQVGLCFFGPFHTVRLKLSDRAVTVH